MQHTTLLLLVLGMTSASAVKWVARNADNKACAILAAETITAKLNFLNDQNLTETVTVGISDAQSVKGKCDDRLGETPANSIEVSFFPNGKKPASASFAQPWTLKLWFTAAENASFKLADYVLTTAPSEVSNSTYTETFTKSAAATPDVHASGNNGFKCSTSGLALSADSTIDMKDARVIAMAALDGEDFPADQAFEQCALDARTSDIVPIVVGACLAGLVVVVLIAYLVGRARAKRQGYASV